MSTVSAVPKPQVIPVNVATVVPALAEATTTSKNTQNIVHGLQFQPYQKTRQLSKSEAASVQNALTRWWGNVIESDGMPVINQLASPLKKGWLVGITSAIGSGALLEASILKDMPHTLANMRLDVAIPFAAYIGLLFGSGFGVQQKRINENVIDFLRFSPVENPSVRVMNADFNKVVGKVLKKNWFNLTVKNGGGLNLPGTLLTAGGAVAAFEFITHHPLQAIKAVGTAGLSVLQSIGGGLSSLF
jgi:hypothetical protein